MEYELIDNKDKKQYEFQIGENIAKIEYIKIEDKKNIYLTHTEISKDLEGRGISSILIKSVLEKIKDKGWLLVPLCPFIAIYIKKHPKWKSLILDGYHVD